MSSDLDGWWMGNLSWTISIHFHIIQQVAEEDKAEQRLTYLTFHTGHFLHDGFLIPAQHHRHCGSGCAITPDHCPCRLLLQHHVVVNVWSKAKTNIWKIQQTFRRASLERFSARLNVVKQRGTRSLNMWEFQVTLSFQFSKTRSYSS